MAPRARVLRLQLLSGGSDEGHAQLSAAVVHVRISSTGNPTVTLAFREVFAGVTELLFPRGGLLGSSTVAQEGHRERCPVSQAVASRSSEGTGSWFQRVVSRAGLAHSRSAWLKKKKGMKLASKACRFQNKTWL